MDMNTNFKQFVQKIKSPIRFGFFLATQLPAAFFVGLRLKHIDEHHCTIGVKHTWFSKNPFKSLYFAAQAMAAEMSTGLLAFGHLYKRNPAVSMLVVKMEVDYLKKGTGKVYFTSNDGKAILDCIESAIQTGEGKTLECSSIGKNENGDTIALFKFTWSFKKK